MLKFSIIIPSLNSAEFIEIAIQSILSQDYPSVECIVVDGGSTDGTADIIKKYGSKIVWVTGKDEGQSDAINKGFTMATGDIVAELDADDTYEKGAFKKVARFFEDRPKIKWVFGKCRVIDRNNNEIRKPITWAKNFLLKRYSYNKLLVVDFIPQPATFLRKELLDEIGPFDKNEHLVMEYDYWLRCGAKYKPGYIDDYLATWRAHPRSKSSINFIREVREAQRIVTKYTSSKVLIALNHLVYYGVILMYSVLIIGSRLTQSKNLT